MASIGDRVLDNGLTVLSTECDRICICNAEPTSFAQANSNPGSSGYRLGYKGTPTIGAPADRSGGGREVTLSAISDGVIDYTGTATHMAYVDTSNSRLLGAVALASSKAVTNGDTFTLTSATVGIPDPA